jgi:hypothetical protein
MLTFAEVFDRALRNVLMEIDEVLEVAGLPDDLQELVADGELTLEEARERMEARAREPSTLELSAPERRVMAHATAWDSDRPLYRNHYCASAGHDNWDTLELLCARGLMRVGRAPEPAGDYTVFMVTETGIEALEQDESAKAGQACRCELRT